MSGRRKPWSEQDDNWLRKFNAEGKSDAWIGEILQRTKVMIQRRRTALGLPPVGKAGGTGCTMPPEARLKIGEASRQRWQDPAYRERMIPHALRGLAKTWDAKFRRPPKGTNAYKEYCKLRNVLGPERARQEMGLT